MTGQILDYSLQEHSGVISGSDNVRYSFDGSDWRGDHPPTRGMTVDFDTEGNSAKNVYPALDESKSGDKKKSKVAAGVLAIIVGFLGVHKFYLGFVGPGLVYLLAFSFCVIGLIFTIVLGVVTAGIGFLFQIPLFFILFCIGIMALIEGIIYLTKSDEEFERLYVVEQKKWF